jgi:hypothetical protein
MLGTDLGTSPDRLRPAFLTALTLLMRLTEKVDKRIKAENDSASR